MPHSPQRRHPRQRLVCLGALAIGLWAQSACAELVFQRESSRQASYEATLRANQLPVVGDWTQAGPFVERLRVNLPAQENPAIDAVYDLEWGGRGGWLPTHGYDDGYANRLDTSFVPRGPRGKDFTVCLRRSITCEQPTKLPIYLGADCPMTLWLNARPVLFAATADRLEAGQEFAVLDLATGENAVVLKLAVTRGRDSHFYFQPELGEGATEELIARLDQEFPRADEPLTGYRERALRASATAEEQSYRMVEIAPPPGAVLEGTGLCTLPEGRLALATRRGFVYLISNPGADDPNEIRFQRFAEGLHEPLGMATVGDHLAVVNRGEVTLLVDSDHDDMADRFESLAGGWGVSGNYHEYAYGLPADRDGYRYIALNLTFGKVPEPAPFRGWVMRFGPSGAIEPFCYGLRSPNGIGANDQGDIFCTDNQGNWVPACPLYHLRAGRWYGNPDSLRWAPQAWPGSPTYTEAAPPERTLPAVWFPYEELSQSATDIVCDTTGGKFGPFAGQLFVGEMTKGLIARVQLEKVAGEYQGACFLFRRGLGAVNRMAFGADGKLYFARCNRGWGGGGLGEGLARLDFTGQTPFEIERVRLTCDGFELTFTKPLAEGSGLDIGDYSIEQWKYHHWKEYGSPKIELEEIAVTAVEVAEDRRGVRLKAEGLKREKVCRISVANVASNENDSLLHADAFYTLNNFADP